MNIGILTYHAVCNFGANLQALSTVQYLRNHGHNPVVIDWLIDELDSRYKRTTPEIQYKEHEEFRKAYLPMTTRCRTSEEVAKVIEKENIDAVIIGSDAVLQHFGFWSRVVIPSRKLISYATPPKDQMCPNPYWAAFTTFLGKRIPVCMMSASSQNAPYKSFTLKELSYLDSFLQRFSYISVRDTWTQGMVSRISKGRIIPEITPDPVFAFNQNVNNIPSKEDILKKYGLPEKYLLVSFHNSNTVSQEWLIELQNEACINGRECVAFPFPQGVEFRHPYDKEINLPLSPIDWYALIKYSSGYVGHNMHPIVVSLHNAVPCFSFDNYGIVKFRLFVNAKSSKIYHIMKTFHVENNCFPCRSKFAKTPTAQHVISAILNFDKESVRAIGDKYLYCYNEMMRKILNIISK